MDHGRPYELNWMRRTGLDQDVPGRTGIQGRDGDGPEWTRMGEIARNGQDEL